MSGFKKDLFQALCCAQHILLNEDWEVDSFQQLDSGGKRWMEIEADEEYMLFPDGEVFIDMLGKITLLNDKNVAHTITLRMERAINEADFQP